MTGRKRRRRKKKKNRRRRRRRYIRRCAGRLFQPKHVVALDLL
jgi:hypothetical protein